MYSSISSVVSGSLQPRGLQHARPPCPSPTPGVYSDSCPSTQWCHPTVSSSVVPFSSCLQSFPASGSFPMSQLFASVGQRTGVSASASVLPMNIWGSFTLGLIWLVWLIWLIGLISLQSKGLSRVFSNNTIQKHQFFGGQPSTVQLSHPLVTTGRTIALARRTFVGKVTSLLFNMLSKFVIPSLPRSKHLYPEKTIIQKGTCTPNVHCSDIYNRQDKSATDMPNDWWMHEEDMVPIYNGLCLSHKKEWNWVIFRDVNGPRVFRTEWSKS